MIVIHPLSNPCPAWVRINGVRFLTLTKPNTIADGQQFLIFRWANERDFDELLESVGVSPDPEMLVIWMDSDSALITQDDMTILDDITDDWQAFYRRLYADAFSNTIYMTSGCFRHLILCYDHKKIGPVSLEYGYAESLLMNQDYSRPPRPRLKIGDFFLELDEDMPARWYAWAKTSDNEIVTLRE